MQKQVVCLCVCVCEREKPDKATELLSDITQTKYSFKLKFSFGEFLLDW